MERPTEKELTTPVVQNNGSVSVFLVYNQRILDRWIKYAESLEEKLRYEYSKGFADGVESPKPTEIVKIPKFLADWIVYCKQKRNFFSYLNQDSFYHEHKEGLCEEVRKWSKMSEPNLEMMARAWLNGYEVEEEQKYFVVVNDLYMVAARQTDTVAFVFRGVLRDLPDDLNRKTFTEAEIKAIDKRFWPFAVPVESEE
jgi:hypothetical protein